MSTKGKAFAFFWFISLILAIWGIFGDNWKLLVIGMAGIIILIIIGIWSAKYGSIAKDAERTKKADEEVRQCCKIINYDTLSVSKRSPYLRDYLSKKTHIVRKYKGEYSKLVYRSATVGGITTGGFSEEGGGYKVRELHSDRYELFFREPGHFGEQYTHEIKRISLNGELLEKAKQTPYVSEYIEGGDIIVVKDVQISDAAVAAMAYGNKIGNNDMGLSIINAEKAEGYPTAEKCNDIIRFLCQSD